ncbi:MAG: hypothetical protein ABFS24_03045 [Pseudomonadota bacterium]
MTSLTKDLPIGALLACLTLIFAITAQAAGVVPNEIKMPGTQPGEVGNFESPDKCDNCHAGYNLDDPGAEPATGWRGAAMGNAGRDPVFWATLAIAEQDFDGAGDLCIRCHSAKGWYDGRSTPTDGSGLAASDDNGIDCDTCHAATNPNNSDPILQGMMNSPFIANCEPDPNVPDKCTKTGSAGEGFYGSGMLSLWPDVNVKLGPYAEDDAEARHQFRQSAWHRDPDFCGSCHDVSNSAVGDLAGNHGTQSLAPTDATVISSRDFDCVDDNGNTILPFPEGGDLSAVGGGCLGGAIVNKAAFNNPPYAYGIVERTFSEYKSSPLSNMRVGRFNEDLPLDLQVAGGSLEVTYQAAIAADPGDPNDSSIIEGDYADGTPRKFSCQSCHMRPTTGKGCNKNVKTRSDLPRHDHTGGNYWFASMAQYQDRPDVGTLRVGGGLNSTQLLAMDLGQERATKHLREAGALSVTGNTVTVTNLTGHKLITGYPEGRRMWLNIKWYDSEGALVGEDGAYGSLQTDMDLDGDGQADAVETILKLDGTNTEIYEAHYAITREWAVIVQAVQDPDFALSYDRLTGLPDCTVSQFLLDDPVQYPDCSGDYHETFHFALNNYVSKDNRIPPYQMSYTEAKKRNALPVPETRYTRTGDTYEHADDVLLNPPIGAVHATIDLLYQGTSWEYIQFLQMANTGENAFLGNQGDAMMDAWLNADVVQSTGAPITGVQMINGDYKMVPPVVMYSVEWGTPPVCNPTPGQETQETFCTDGVDNDCDGFTDASDTDCLTGQGCSIHEDKGSCNNDPVCDWQGSPKNGQCVSNVCTPEGPTELTCDDGVDNDCNGLVDCDDIDNCGGDPVCEQVDCSQYNGDKTSCNAQATCSYSNKNKVCSPI